MKRNFLLNAVLVGAMALGSASLPAVAQSHGGHGLADGEIRKVDKDAQKLTIKHGPMPEFDMPTAMTMVYRVKDPAMLGQVKRGDKVKFEAEKIGGQFVVTRIEAAK